MLLLMAPFSHVGRSEELYPNFRKIHLLPSKPSFVFEVVSNGDSKIGLEVGESCSCFSSLLLLDFGTEGQKERAGVGSQVDKQR